MALTKKLVKRDSLSDQATDILKESILSLEIEPGERLIVDDLAEKFNISRTPIREALKNLSAQGLITYNGIVYRVTKLTREDVIELYMLREALEVLAAIHAAYNVTDQQLKKLEQINASYDMKLSQRKLIDMDMEFHQLIQEASQIGRLATTLKGINEQILLVRRWLFQDQSKKAFEEDTIHEHTAILAGIAEHDGQKAASAMQFHLTQGKSRLLALLDTN